MGSLGYGVMGNLNTQKKKCLAMLVFPIPSLTHGYKPEIHLSITHEFIHGPWGQRKHDDPKELMPLHAYFHHPFLDAWIQARNPSLHYP